MTALRVASTQGAGIEVLRPHAGGNRNLRAQRGVFTVVRAANTHFLDHGQWPALEELDRPPDLWGLTLEASEADELLRLLNGHDVSRHTLVPTLENAAKAYDYELRLLPPE